MLKVGGYNWSDSQIVNFGDNACTDFFECKLPGNTTSSENVINEPFGDGRVLILSCVSKLVNSQYLEITVFSKVVVIDRTRLDISIFSHSKHYGRGHLRHTWAVEKVINPNLKDKNNHLAVPANTIKKSKSELDIMPKSADKVLNNIVVNSRRSYEVSTASIGSHVYTDRKFRWIHLPSIFHNQCQIKTPFEDMALRSSKIYQFTVTQDSIVFIFADVKSPPSWIDADDFRSINEIAVASRLRNGFVEELHYSVYGKYYPKDSTMSLKGNWNKQMTSMYSIIIIPYSSLLESAERFPAVETSFGTFGKANDVNKINLGNRDPRSYAKSVREDVRFSEVYKNTYVNQLWSEGGENITLMHTEDNLLSVGILKGTVWTSDAINIDTKKNSATKGSFEIADLSSTTTFMVSYALQQLPGFYGDCQVR